MSLQVTGNDNSSFLCAHELDHSCCVVEEEEDDGGGDGDGDGDGGVVDDD